MYLEYPKVMIFKIKLYIVTRQLLNYMYNRIIRVLIIHRCSRKNTRTRITGNRMLIKLSQSATG